MNDYLKIGSYTEATDEAPAVIEREYHGLGMIFKDEEAFYNHYDKPCYVPELSDNVYTKQDFINICGGREDLAEICFDIVDWQHPESWVEEQFANGDWDKCPVCGWWYSLYGKPQPCEKCGGPLEYKWGRVSRDGITKTTPDILRQVIDNRKPLGLFYAPEGDGYTAVDNHDGNAWTEAFLTLQQCEQWLLNQYLTAGGQNT